ncbi:hypothetical protein NN561_008177 [Cricetulus griseus]
MISLSFLNRLGVDILRLFQGSLSMGKFWPGGYRPVSLERQRVALPSRRGARGSTLGRDPRDRRNERRKEKSDQREPGSGTMLRAEPPWALASERGSERSPSRDGSPSRVSARRDSEGGGGDDRTHPAQPRRSSRLGAGAAKIQCRLGRRTPRLYLHRPLAAAAPSWPRRHAHPEPRPRPAAAGSSIVAQPTAYSQLPGDPLVLVLLAAWAIDEAGSYRPRERRSWVDPFSALAPVPTLGSSWKMDAPCGQPERGPAHPAAAALGGFASLCWGSALWATSKDLSELGMDPFAAFQLGSGHVLLQWLKSRVGCHHNRLKDVGPQKENLTPDPPC